MPADVSQVIGIDLGTTFSVVGIWKNGKAEIIANKEGSRTTPSCVSYTPKELLVGNAAKTKQDQNLENTVYDMKRLLGKAYDPEIGKKMGWPFVVKKGTDDRPLIHVKHLKEPKTVSPEDVSALILKKMKETIERNTGGKISKAVITVPAYFSQAQKQATINAAKIAELEVKELITEPAAAAYAYGFHNKNFDNHNLLVFDFGGGTFDVVLIKVEKASFQVESIEGDTQLGGRDIDTILVEHFAKKIEELHGTDVLEDKRLRQKLLKECVEIKHLLSSDQEAELYLGNVLPDIDEDDDEDTTCIKITREEFDEICDELFKRIISITQNCLFEAKMKPADMHKVLLIGGSSRIPKLQELLADIFTQDKLDCSLNADEAVAIGAAVRAAQICETTTFNAPPMTLIEATPLSLGTDTTHGRFSILIPRNTCIPCRKTSTFYTSANDQKVATFEIFEGQRPLTVNNNFLGKFSIGNITPGVASSQAILLTFDLNKNGILKVSASHKDEKAELRINYIQNKSPQKNIEDLLKEAKLFKEQDDKTYAAMNAKSSLGTSINKVKYRILKETLTDSQKTQLQNAVNEVEKWFKDTTSNEKNVYEEKKTAFENLCKNI
uniref:Heat shock protein 70 n=1 Tax=Panagrolaimus sp. PS1159 TaxID=55785 RepID=A0AC35ERS1_9BILA